MGAMHWLQILLQGALLGGLYALFAIGLSLSFGIMRLVNIAHGDLIVLAAYLFQGYFEAARARILERRDDNPFHTASRVQFLLRGDLILCAALQKSARAAVRALCVLTKDDEINLFNLALAQRRQTRIKQTVAGSLRDEFGLRTVHDVVSGERDHIMNSVREKVDQDLKRIGVVIIDVRLKRVDLPQDVSESVYRRMEAERKRIANELRSTGFAEAERIRADADRQREVILAVAYRDAQRVRGEGDAKAANIYAQAFSQNPEFFSFYRSMEAYRSTFRGRNDLMLLEPNSDFFRYLKDAFGRQSTRK